MAGEFKMRNSMVNFFAIFNFSRRLYYIVLNDSLLSNPHRKFLNVIINRIIILYMGSVAEWSKALVLGTSLSGRGFESHRCQTFFLGFCNKSSPPRIKKANGDEGDRTPGISNANRALYH